MHAPVHSAELRAHASYVQYLSETARAPKGRGPWAELLADAAQVRFAIGGLQRHSGVTRFERCGPTRSALREAVGEVSTALESTASRLERAGDAASTPVDVAALTASTRGPVRECLDHHAHDSGADGPRAAGIDAALARDLIVEVAVLADDALTTVPKLPE